MKAFAKYAALVLILVLAISLSACGAQKPEKQILGEWRTANQEVSWIFYEDGQIVAVGDGDTESGQWYINEDTLSLVNAYDTTVFYYSIDGRKLSLYEDGEFLEALYKVTDKKSDFKYSEDVGQELAEELTETEIFKQTMDNYKDYVSADLSSIDGNMNQNGDVAIHYMVKTIDSYAHLDVIRSYDLRFAYSPFAEDFYFDGRTREPESYVWDEEGISSLVDEAYFAEMFEDEGELAGFEYVGMTTNDSYAVLTYRVNVEIEYEYAVTNEIYEVVVNYGALSDSYGSHSDPELVEDTTDWSGIYGTWVYDDGENSLSVTIDSIDGNDVALTYNYNGTSGQGTYTDDNRSWSYSQLDISFPEIAISIKIDCEYGLDCRLTTAFWATLYDMVKTA